MSQEDTGKKEAEAIVVPDELLAGLIVQADALNDGIRSDVWKEPENLLGAYANSLKGKVEAISTALDSLDEPMRAHAQKKMFFTLTSSLVKKMSIHSPLFAREMMDYFKVMLSYLLPLRLHDATFITMVTDEILDNKKMLWGKDSMNDSTKEWEKMGLTPKLYLNKLALQERENETNQEQSQFVVENSLYSGEGGGHWRDNLVPGHYIEVLRDEKITDPDRKTQSTGLVKGWTRAKIIEVLKGDLLEDEQQVKQRVENGGPLTKRKIAFQYCGEKKNDGIQISISSESSLLAPVGFYTPGWEDRLAGVKPMAVFDVCDEMKNWYKATIVDRFPAREGGVDCDGVPVEECTVGLRWLDEFGVGLKTDKKFNLPYHGFGETLDLRRTVSMSSIQPAGSMVKPYTTVQQMKIQNEIRDHSEQVFTNKTAADKPFLYCAYREDLTIDKGKVEWWNKSSMYTNLLTKHAQKFDRFIFIIEALNKFGKHGGFDRLLKLIGSYSEESCKLDTSNLLSFMKFLVTTCYHMHRQFATQFIAQLKDVFASCVKASKSPFLSKQMTADNSELIKEYYVQILSRYEAHDLVEKTIEEKYSSVLIYAWLKNKENLEKRITAVRHLEQQINACLLKNNDKANQALMAPLQEHNVFSLLYSRENHHSQLCSRSQRIFDMHVKCQKVNNKELDLLWELVLSEEQAKHDVYHLLINGKFFLNEQLIGYFFDKFENLAPNNVTQHDLKFLYQMADENTQKDGPKIVAAKALWQISTLQKQGYQRVIYEASRKHFLDLLKKLHDKQYEEYTQECCDSLGEADNLPSSVQIILILKELIKAYPIDAVNKWSTATEQQNRAKLVSDLTDQGHLKIKLFQEIESYMKIAKAEEQLNEGNVSTLELSFDKFTHQMNLETRIDLLMFIQKEASIAFKVKAGELNQLYDNLLKEKRLRFDAEMFYKWFNFILSNKNWIEVEVVIDFFNQKFLTNPAIVHEIDSVGFACVMQMFLMINEAKDNLFFTVSTEQENYNSLRNKGTTQTKKSQFDFTLQVDPSQLEGIDIIWQMYEHSQQGQQVGNEIGDFLAKLYYSSKPEVYKMFIDECFMRIKSHNDPLKQSQIIKQTMHMWNIFFTETEKNRGTAKMRAHQTLDTEAYMINNLILIPSIGTPLDKAKYLVFNVESTMTVFELINKVAEHYEKSPLKTYLVRSDLKEVGRMEFSLTLGELKFEDNEEVEVKSIFEYKKQVDLIEQYTHQKALNPKARAIFRSWFEQYSQPDEEYGTVMVESGVTRFLQSIKQFASQELLKEKVVEFFESCGWNYVEELEESIPKITEEKFLAYYKRTARNAPKDVWQDLSAKKISDDLEPISSKDEEEDCVKDVSTLPRYSISNNQEQLLSLFKMGENLDSETSKLIWKTISSLKTNTELYSQILANDKNLLEFLRQPDLLENMPIYQLLYFLQIIKFLLKKVLDEKLNNEMAVYVEKSQDQGNDQQRGIDNDEDDIDAEKDEANKKESKDQKIIREWKGETRKEQIHHDLFQAKEQAEIELKAKELLNDQDIKFDELHSRWLVDFISKQGLDALQNIMNTFTKKTTNFNFAESKCLHLAAYITKVILVGCFACNDASGQSGVLLRRMSSNYDQANVDEEIASTTLLRKKSSTFKKEEKKPEEKVQRNENINELVQLLENAEPMSLTDDLLENLNKEQMLNQLQNLLELVVKEEEPSEDDIGIVKECLNIWTSFVTYSPHLLASLYVKDGQNKRAHFIEVLVTQGLMGKNKDMRFQFKEALLFVCKNVKKTMLPEPPANLFLCVLLEKLSSVVKEVDPKNTKEYFQLFRQLTQRYFQDGDLNKFELFKEKELLHQVLDHLKDYNSSENKGNAGKMCDNTLGGLIAGVTALLTGAHKKSLKVFEGNQLKEISELILKKLLFGVPVKEEDLAHVEKEEDLVIFDKASGYKCHHDDSRQAAYHLFLFVVENFLNNDEFDGILSNYWTNLVMKMEKPQGKKYDPSSSMRAENGFAGLKNLGATCYMNSMIQQFYNVPIFRYSMMNADDQAPPAIKNHQGRQIDDNFLHQTQRLFTTLELTDRIDYNTRDYCYSYKEGNEPVNVRVQQDATEFLSKNLDRLEEKLKNSRGDKYLCQNVFQGEKANLKVCGGCGNKSETLEPFLFQQVQVQQKASILDGLENTIKGEIISDYQCDACNERVELTKRSVIKQLPNVLIVNLNRLIFCMETFVEIKVNAKCEFPKNLNMRPYMYDEVQRIADLEAQQNEGADPSEIQKEMEQEPVNEEEFEYKLVGILIHMGGAQAGHYISYINVDRETDKDFVDPAEQRWYEFNDSRVKDFNFKENVESHCFGGMMNVKSENKWDNDKWMRIEQSHNAYMLVYEKRTQVPFKIDLDKDHIEKIKIADALQTIQAQLPRCYQLYPNLFDQVRAGDIHFDEEKKEHYALVDQTIFNKIIPVQRQLDTLMDNQKFLVEKQVFSTAFFETTTQLFEKVICNLEERAKNGDDVTEQCSAMYKILDHMIFELMANTKNPTCLVQLTDQMLRVAFTNRATMKRMVDERIFVPAEKLEKDEKNFFEVLVFHTEPEIRQMASDILQHVFAHSYKELMTTEEHKEENIALCDKIADGVMNLMRSECPKALWKLNEYFDFFEKLMLKPGEDDDNNSMRFITEQQRNNMRAYFEMRRILPRFFDLITKAVTESATAFNKALKIILHLVKKQPVMIYDYSKDISCGEKQASAAEIIEMVKADPSLVSPYFDGDLDKLDESCFLDSYSLQAMFMDGDQKSKLWLQNLLKDITYTNDLQILIGHLCWKNLQFSRKAGKVILKGCNKHKTEEVMSPILIANEYLTLKDEFQRNRVEWMLGLPSFEFKETHGNNELLASLRVGCQQIRECKDQVYTYKTNLFPAAGGWGTPDSFLQKMYEKKDFWSDGALHMLGNLIHACTEKDANSLLLKTLLTIPGPSYGCVRYWDWIEPHCVSQLAKKYGVSEAQQQVYTQILVNIKTLRQEKTALFGDINDPETRQLLEADGDRLTDPYLVWKNVGGAEWIDVKTDAANHLECGAGELKTTVSKSLPQGGLSNEYIEDMQIKKSYSFHSYNIQKEVRHKKPQEEGVVKDVEDDDETTAESQAAEEVKQAVLVMAVHNTHKYMRNNCIIRWNQAKRDEFNFLLPYNDLKVKQVQKQSMKAVMAFTKLRLDEPWGPIKEIFELVHYDPENDKGQKRMRRQAYKQQHPADAYAAEEEEQAGNQCAHCTTINDPDSSHCNECYRQLD